MKDTLPAILDPALPGLAEAVKYAAHSLSAETLRGYKADWADFCAWCARNHVTPLPAEPQAVAAYLASLAKTHGRSALRRRLSAIGQAHRLKQLDWMPGHPAIRHTLRGILRQHGTPPRQAAALTTPEIAKLVATCDGGLTGCRDRALLLLGYAGALRRSELAAVQREEITFVLDGLRLLVPKSKTDPEGQGVELGIPRGAKKETCPVRALQRWIEVSRCEYGPVFRKVDQWGGISHDALHPDAVRYILQLRAKAAGLKLSITERLSPHGLRAGMITAAYQAGARDEEIMGHSRHKSHTAMRGYVRRAKIITESPAKKLGL